MVTDGLAAEDGKTKGLDLVEVTAGATGNYSAAAESLVGATGNLPESGGDWLLVQILEDN